MPVTFPRRRWPLIAAFSHTSCASVDANVRNSVYDIVASAHEPRSLQLVLKFNF